MVSFMTPFFTTEFKVEKIIQLVKIIAFNLLEVGFMKSKCSGLKTPPQKKTKNNNEHPLSVVVP